MKKILVFLGIFAGLIGSFNQQVFAFDIVPQFVSMVQTNTVGLYQVPNEIKLYSQADDTSELIEVIKWNKDGIDPNIMNAQDLFVIYLPDENTGFLAVMSENENWMQVIYNNSTGDMAWIKKDTPANYLTWEKFFDVYGHKYGLKILSGTADDEKNIYSEPDDYSKVIGKAYKLQKINLHSIKGDYASVTVIDIENNSKTGYIRWRDEYGIKYFFPDIP